MGRQTLAKVFWWSWWVSHWSKPRETRIWKRIEQSLGRQCIKSGEGQDSTIALGSKIKFKWP